MYSHASNLSNVQVESESFRKVNWTRLELPFLWSHVREIHWLPSSSSHDPFTFAPCWGTYTAAVWLTWSHTIRAFPTNPVLLAKFLLYTYIQYAKSLQPAVVVTLSQTTQLYLQNYDMDESLLQISTIVTKMFTYSTGYKNIPLLIDYY